MKSLFTNTISEMIQYDEVGGSTSRPFIRTEYFDDSLSTWVDFEDVETRSIEFSNENKRYGSYSFLPPSNNLSLVLNNFGQIYSTGSGTPKASILKKNLKIRCWSGYELAATAHNSYSDDLSTGVKLFHVAKAGSSLIPAVASVSATSSKYADLITFDEKHYDDWFYDAAGYYYKHYSLPSTAYDSVEKITVTTTSDKFDLRFRVGHLGWSPIYPLSTGATDVLVDSSADTRSFEYILRFKNTNWGTADKVTGIKVHTRRKGYLFNRGTFIADEPKYAEKVTVEGRDYLKKALETQINLPVMSSTNIGTAITYVLDRCNIPYSVSRWDLTSSAVSVTGTLAESLNNISGWKALDHLMDALNAGDDDWRIKWEEDGGISLKRMPTDVEADWNIHYFYNIEEIQKDFASDKQLQRVTVMNKDILVNPEVLLKTKTGTTSSTSLHATYGTTALYVRYEDPNNILLSETARTNTGISFSVNSGAAYTLKFYGCKHKNPITYERWAEKGNCANIKKNDGQTYKLINPVLSASQASALAGYMMAQYGEPAKAITLSMKSNPYLELNDNVLVYDLYTYTDDIYIINSIKESWNDPSLVDSLELKDRGLNLGSFIWDRNGWDEGLNDLNWDTGLVFDQDIRIGLSDTASY